MQEIRDRSISMDHIQFSVTVVLRMISLINISFLHVKFFLVNKIN